MVEKQPKMPAFSPSLENSGENKKKRFFYHSIQMDLAGLSFQHPPLPDDHDSKVATIIVMLDTRFASPPDSRLVPDCAILHTALQFLSRSNDELDWLAHRYPVPIDDFYRTRNINAGHPSTGYLAPMTIFMDTINNHQSLQRSQRLAQQQAEQQAQQEARQNFQRPAPLPNTSYALGSVPPIPFLNVSKQLYVGPNQDEIANIPEVSTPRFDLKAHMNALASVREKIGGKEPIYLRTYLKIKRDAHNNHALKLERAQREVVRLQKEEAEYLQKRPHYEKAGDLLNNIAISINENRNDPDLINGINNYFDSLCLEFGFKNMPQPTIL